MKKYKFILYGIWAGSLSAVIGGITFGILGTLYFLTTWNDSFEALLLSVGFASFFSAVFAVIPGALGGVYLAYWLEKSKRTPRETTNHSLFVGAVAGLFATLTFVGVVLRFEFDWSMIGFSILAIIVASGISLLAAKLLTKRLETSV